VLCTSKRMMTRLAEQLQNQCSGLEVKVQGDAGRAQLVAWFKAATNGVLVATRSFYQGIDIPGEALRLVIIDRMPYPAAKDPLEEAIGRLLVQRYGGSSAFLLRSLPECCRALAQGSGRLIRTHTDRGVVLVLDSRFNERKAYAERLRKSVPPFPISRDIDDVGRVLNGEEPTGVAVVRVRTFGPSRTRVRGGRIYGQ